MELAPSFKDRITNLVFKDALPFTKKRDINWKIIRNVLIAGVAVGVFVILILPTPKEEQKIFYEKSDGRVSSGAANSARENNPTEDALAQLQGARSQNLSGNRSLDFSGYANRPSGGGISQNQNSAMILTRGGLDAKTQLPPGSRILVKLDQAMTLDSHSMPIIATVTKDVAQEDGIAIPEGAKLFGDASFDDNSERVQVNWKTIQLPNGSMKPFSGIVIGHDGQVGIEGSVHSDATRNAIGQTVTRFISAYADGSMQRGAFGGNPGGHDNGMKNAIAETAKDRANNWAEDMKKERKWVELQSGTSFFAVVTQAFQFRDPGNSYGR